jgi:hypothetical protein
MTAVATSAERSESGTRDLISAAEFRGWLARAASCSWFEYHGGLLIWESAPASALSDEHRRALAKMANAVFQAAEQGEVHLVQRRNGPFDFSYVAIKARPARGKRVLRSVPAAGVDDLPAAA